jgi:hypothetical protein
MNSRIPSLLTLLQRPDRQNPRKWTLFSPLSPLFLILTSIHRFYTKLRKITPLFLILTDIAPVSPLFLILTKNRGKGYPLPALKCTFPLQCQSRSLWALLPNRYVFISLHRYFGHFRRETLSDASTSYGEEIPNPRAQGSGFVYKPRVGTSCFTNLRFKSILGVSGG